MTPFLWGFVTGFAVMGMVPMFLWAWDETNSALLALGAAVLAGAPIGGFVGLLLCAFILGIQAVLR